MNQRTATLYLIVLGITLTALLPANAQESTSDTSVKSVTTAEESSSFSWPKTFKDWFQTPEQQAARAWESGDIESLKEVAPNASWQGVAAYQSGEFEAAKEAFANAMNPAENASATQPGDITRSVFNQATTDIKLGNYAQAIEQLDSLLAEQPDHADALRNKAIADRLLALEQQPTQNDEQPGEQEDSSDSDDSSESENNSDSSESDEQEGGQENEQQSSESDSNEESSDQQGESQEQSEESDSEQRNDASDSDATDGDESDEEIEAARQALQAAGEEAQEQPEDAQSQPVGAELLDEPLSEQDQASEQWLRQIPDDPDDLLRRKLLQNHRNEYPDVQVNGRGW